MEFLIEKHMKTLKEDLEEIQNQMDKNIESLLSGPLFTEEEDGMIYIYKEGNLIMGLPKVDYEYILNISSSEK